MFPASLALTVCLAGSGGAARRQIWTYSHESYSRTDSRPRSTRKLEKLDMALGERSPLALRFQARANAGPTRPTR